MKKLFLILSILSLSTVNESNIIGFCDIKGYVNNPGVYEIEENYTIQDVIKLAGGLKKNAYTDNINLSKKVTDEMVIYIFNNKEINEIKQLNNCECTPIYKYIECVEEATTLKTTQHTTSKPVSKNTTTTTRPNIISTTTPASTTNISTTVKTTTATENIPSTTESIKKININTCLIEELTELNGLGEIKAKKIIEYRENNGLFQTIEDLLKVNGIGSATFEKIKNFIEV